MPPTFLADTPTNSDLDGKLICKLNSYNCSIIFLTTGDTECDKLDNKKYTENNYTKGEQDDHQQ